MFLFIPSQIESFIQCNHSARSWERPYLAKVERKLVSKMLMYGTTLRFFQQVFVRLWRKSEPSTSLDYDAE